MQSVVPTVSSVAWSTYLSGRNPGGHNIYGFIERDRQTGTLYLPNAVNRRGPALYKTLGNQGIPVIMMNIPVTYPPEPVNGILVGCFLGMNPQKIAWPRSVSQELADAGYIIDADTASAREKPQEFIDQLIGIIRKRCSIFKELLQKHPWRFAHLHIMETDRLFHFLWSSVKNPDSELHPGIKQLLQIMDEAVSSVIDEVSDNDEVMILSDHGFCSIDTEWDLNAWLAENGWLSWAHESERGFRRIASESQFFSLLPGRIYLNNQVENCSGKRTSGSQADNRMIEELIMQLKTVRTGPEDRPVFSDVARCADFFRGEFAGLAPDVLAVPVEGVDLKARMEPGPVRQKSRLEGMHTLENAMIWFRHGRMQTTHPAIIDMYPTILSYFGLTEPGMEGKCIVAWT